MNLMPIQYGVDPYIPQVQHYRSLSLHLPHLPSNVAQHMPYNQQHTTDQLLQVPGPNSPSKGPVSPSRKTILEPNNMTQPPNAVEWSRKAPKTKPLASTKKAEQLSEELASEIAKYIDLSKGHPENIQAAIKSRVLLTLNPSLSRKRTAQMASMKEDLIYPKRKKITCNQCSITTAR